MNNATKVDQWWGSHCEYYYDAFAEEYRRIWRGIKAVAGNDDELVSICYYRMHMAFLRSDPAAIVDRRRLLYAYLLSEFKADHTDDTLNRYRKQLPTKSGVRRVIKNLCTAYDEEPDRRFSAIDADHDIMESLYSQMKVATQFQRIYHRARLTGLVLARPLFLNGRWHIDYMTPDQFRIDTHPDDVRTITAVIYPRDDGRGGVEYVRWTAEAVETINYDGITTEVRPHGYGRLPFVPCRLNDDDEEYTSAMFELVESQIEINKTDFLARLNATFAGFPVWVGVNLGLPSASISPDRIITVEGVQMGEGAEAHPTLDSITPDPAYQTMADYQAQQERMMQHAEGIPPSMTASEAQTPPSGISRVIERNEIIELRYSDQKALREFEREFAVVTAIVARTDAGTSVDSANIDLQVSYAEESVIIEPEKEYELDKRKLQDYVMTASQFYRKWGGLDLSEEKLSEELQRRREESTQLFTTVNEDTV